MDGGAGSLSDGGSDGGTDAGADGGAADAGPILLTTLGPVRGTQVGGLFELKGIPFAAPPLGDLRWRPPRPAAPWTEVRDATAYGDECVQLNYDGTASDAGSEDCLTLNVWMPAARPATPLPILVYVHGGYFVGGSASVLWHGELLYDGSYLAETGPAVVVTLQYRLGALGFLSDSALTNPGDASGNFGLQDQIAALQWVQANAAALGGDPSRVTIFGQSAGGVSVCELLTSPLSAGLFSAAMIQSGGCHALTAAAAATQAAQYEAELGCADAGDLGACMRAVPASVAAATLPAAGNPPLMWSPTVDGVVLPELPYDVLASSTLHSVPVIVGNTSNEMSSQIQYYALPYNPPTDQAQYQADLQALFPANWSQVEAEYPLGEFSADLGPAAEAIISVLTDELYVCPGRAIVRRLAGQPRPAWRYIFEHAWEAADFPPGDPDPLTPYGAYHLIDVPYFFHAVAPTDFTWSADELTLSVQAAGYLLSFAATGDPNSASAPANWPAYEYSATAPDGGPDAEWHLALDVPPAAHQYYRSAVCDFWDQIEGL